MRRTPKRFKHLPALIRELREDRDWSQQYLAQRAGLSLNQVGRIERGESEPSLATLYAIARALELEVDDLLNPPEKAAV